MPLPVRLALPLTSRRCSFTTLMVKDGASVAAGQALAVDPANFGVPLIAPCSGTVSLDPGNGGIVVNGLSPYPPTRTPAPAGRVERRAFMVEKGVWLFFGDAYSCKIPDPLLEPLAVIVSTMNLEPFVSRGDAQLEERFDDFVKGSRPCGACSNTSRFTSSCQMSVRRSRKSFVMRSPRQGVSDAR